MADYSFYSVTYLGNAIPAAEFSRLALRAQAQLDLYKRQYRVEGDAQQQDMAVCAMADALYYYEAAANGGITSSCSVGSVSSSQAVTPPDTSHKAQSAELYRCVKQHLTIYRGVG